MASSGVFRIGDFVLTQGEVRRRKDYLGIGEEEERLLREIHPYLLEKTEQMVERFYDYLLAHEHTRRMLAEPGLIERLKKQQSRYFRELTAGLYDLAYFENRLRVGLVHERIGLSPEWYLGAYQGYLCIANEVLSQAFRNDSEYLFRASDAFSKVVFLDMSLAIDAYTLSSNQRLAKEAAALAQANERLKQLDSAKRTLTEMIVHDLQNPLTGIVAFLQVLQGKKDGISASERRALRQALARCDDLSQLIMNVQQLSRAEEGKLELYYENVDLAGVARRAAEAFALAAEAGGRRVTTNVGKQPVMVRTDQSLLRRVLDNLIRNSLRHTPEGTRVEVHVSPGPPARVSVRDDGPGMPLRVRAKMAEPFTNDSLHTAVWSAESGLGLSFCRMAAAALSLSFKVESQVGRGTTFLLELPAKDDRSQLGDAPAR